MCKLFREYRILERTDLESSEPEFLTRIETKRKEVPFLDYRGNLCWWTDLLFIVDPRFPVGDVHHLVAAEVHRHRTDEGIIGGSGRWDPSKARLQINGSLYARFKTKGMRAPRCELCENGDMILPSERFFDSVYKPGTDEP